MTDTVSDSAAERLARRAGFWQSLCAAFLAGGVLLSILAGILLISPGTGGAAPAALAGVAALSFVLSYASRRACLSCWQRCDQLGAAGSS